MTNRCNLRCAHCSIRYAENLAASSVELSDRAFGRFVDGILPHLKTLKLGGNGLGEQLCARRFAERLEPILDSGVRLTLQTNGLLLDDETIEALVAAGAEFDISMEGADEESYASVRGPHFDRLIASVRRIATARARLGTDSRIVFSVALFRDNARQLPALVGLAADLGADAVAVMHLIPVWEEQRYQSLVYHRDLSNEAIARAAALAAERGVEIVAPRPFGAGSMDPSSGGAQAGRPPAACAHPWSSVSVTERGEVTPCCNSYMVMGDLEERPFREIWNGRRYRRLRETVNTPGAPANCRTCVLRDHAGTDEPVLLAAIGPNPRFSQSMIVARGVQRALGRSRIGAKVLPWLKKAYRRVS